MTATLKRKLAAGHPDGSATQMTALRALRLSMARAASDLFDMALAVSGGKQARVRPDDLTDVLSDDDMLCVLDCPGGLTGAAAISLPLVGALIQQQTMGRVLDRPTQPRAFTDTDAALAAPLIEGLLTRACELAEDGGDQDTFRTIRFGARGEDARSVLLGLRAKRYRTFTLTLDIALGLHQAQMILVLPEPVQDVEEGAITPETTTVKTGAKSPLLAAETELTAILARIHLPVSKMNALQVGDTLPLPRDRLDDTALVTVTDQVVARGKLGQMNGHRAVRLMDAPPVPKIASPDRFEPQATANTLPALTDQPPPEPAPAPIDDISVDDLSMLPTQEAVDQISSLAGFTEEDLAMMNADPSEDGVDLPATFGDGELDLSAIDLSDLE